MKRGCDFDKLHALLVRVYPSWRETIGDAFPEAPSDTLPTARKVLGEPASVGERPGFGGPIPPVLSDEELETTFHLGGGLPSSVSGYAGLRAVAALAAERARPRISKRSLELTLASCSKLMDEVTCMAALLREAGVIVEETPLPEVGGNKAQPADDVPESVYRVAWPQYRDIEAIPQHHREAIAAAYRETLRLMRERELPSANDLRGAYEDGWEAATKFGALPTSEHDAGVSAVARLVRDRIVGEGKP